MAAKGILVIGGGIGGLAAAIAARRAGIEVDLIEVRTDWKVYHVGILVQGNFLRALERLDIVDEVVAAGFAIDRIEFQDLRGNGLFTITGTRLASPQYPTDLGITRPALHDVLTRNARRLGARVRLGTTFTEIDTSGARPHVTFTDGTASHYDFVVASDGVHSAARKALFGEGHRPRFSGQGVWRYNVPRPPELDHMIMCMGLTRGKCGFTPVNQQTGYVLLVQAEPGNPRHPDDELATIMRKRLSALSGPMAALRDQITDSSQVVYRPLEVILMPSPWYRNGALLIGDAAHATTPHLGQGAAQAVEDALVVTELLKTGLTGDALGEAYMQRRYDRLKFIWEASVQVGQWEQTEDPHQDPGGLTRKMLEVVAQPI
jgi:2-polyprenyl-6-methoxyphenol hydroxylase-like FAD-dependent oxidoreductase